MLKVCRLMKPVSELLWQERARNLSDSTANWGVRCKMIEKCFDEGTIQAFLDRELDDDLLEKVACHTTVCENCLLLLHEAEEQSAFAFSMISSEFDFSVPSEKIRADVYQAIARIEKPKHSYLQRILGCKFNFYNPSLPAFASLLLVAGLFAFVLIFFNSRKDEIELKEISNLSGSSQTELAFINDEPKQNLAENARNESKVLLTTSKPYTKSLSKPYRATYNSNGFAGKAGKTTNYRESIINENLPGEESYIKTISTLTEKVNMRKNEVLRPSTQVEFERNLAVVDDAIAKMRKEIRKNSKNEAAKQVLRASYENKIDLLNSVAEKTDLIAGIR